MPKPIVKVEVAGRDLFSKRIALAPKRIRTAAQPVVDSSLVAWWRLDETSGTSAADSAGANTGAVNGGPTLTGDGYTFDGVNDYVQAADAASLDLTAAFTIHARINATTLDHAGGGNNQRIFGKDAAYDIRVNNAGSIGLRVFKGAVADLTAFTANGVIATGVTYTVDVTWDGTTVGFYRDGALVSTSPLTGPIDSTTGVVQIGAATALGSRYWAGSIANVRLYNRALSPSEVAILHGNIAQTRTVLQESAIDGTSLVGVSVRKTGNKSTQGATLTVSNEDGTLWSDEFPARAPVTVAIDGKREFSGYVDHLAVGAGKPGTINVECVGRSMRLRDMEVRPIVRDSALASEERDSAGVVATVSGGQIQLPSSALYSPIDDLFSVTVAGEPVLALNLDKENGTIYVDGKHNGADATVNYSVFKARYEATAASTIIEDLVSRHGDGTFDTSGVAAIATTLTFEPGRDSDLYTELGRIRDFLGGTYDFYLDDDDVLHFGLRSGASVAVVGKRDVRTAAFSVDYSAYANKVTVRSSDAKTNAISVAPGPFKNVIEGLTPTGTEADIVAQGFRALDTEARSLRILAKRETEDDAIDWSVQYNGKRRAITESFGAAHSLTPDSVNISIDTANDRIRVKANGAGTAYFSSGWHEDLNQDSNNTTSPITTTSNIYQTVSVADLTRKTVKGIAIKTATATNGFSVKIHSGSGGNAGTLLGTSESVPLGANDHEMETDWFAVYFNDAVDLSGETTVSIVPNSTAGTFDWARQSTDVYAGGAASPGGDFTFQFFTVEAIDDLLAGLVAFDHTVAVANKTPQYFIARDYAIGDPDSANWVEVLSWAPRLFPASTTSDLFGIKVAFNSASITTDPLLSEIHGSVAYLDAGAALDEWSGIVVGGHSGTIGADALPFYNEDSGTFTNPIDMDHATRLEPDGNYWLVLSDGNQDDGGVSHYTVYYDDGASATYTEDWGDETAISTSADLDVSDSEAAIDRNKKSSSFLTGDLLTTGSAITHGLFVPTGSELGGRTFTLLTRNRRNYYNPERSTTITDAAANTGEICILQFDAGDTAPIGGSGTSSVIDQSGQGYNATGVETASILSSNGKYGNGITVANTRDASGRVEDISMWIDGDFTYAAWVKPTAALSASYIFYHGVATNTTQKLGIFAKATAAGQIQVGHTYNDGASIESFTTDNTASATVLTNGTWAHLAVRRTGRTTYDVYLDGVLKNTFTIVNPPDIPGNTGATGTADDPFVFQPRTGGVNPPGALTAMLDEVRLWPRVVEEWVLLHVMAYAYRSVGAKLAFPAEADATDDYTDTATAADGTTTRIRVAQFQWTAPYYEDGVLLRLPLNRDTFNLNGTIVGATDVSSYAHAVTGTGTVNPLYGSGASGTDRADFAGGALYVTNDDNTHFGSAFGLMAYVQQDAAGALGTVFSKAGEIRVDLYAIDASNSTMVVEMTCQGGVTRNPSAFRSVPIGTALKHIALTYDGQVISLYLDGVFHASQDFGSQLPIARSTSAFYLGAQNTPGGAASALTNPFNGKMDEIIWLNYVPTATDIAAIDSDYAVGRRSPVQQGYVVAAYDGTGVKAYANGKYLVSRDDGATAVDALDGSTSNPYGSLCFQMEFGKANVQCVRRNETEIARAGIEVGKVFTVAALDKETLCSVAEGYLAMLSDGLAKGTTTHDGAFPHDVGDIATINYPEKGQDHVEYAVAAVEITVTPEDFASAVQWGEEERSIAALIRGGEVGIG